MDSEKHHWHQKAIDILVKSGTHLQLHPDSICTACLYLHRYNDFLQNNPDENIQYDIGVVLTTALYIATKTMENHIQLSELISSVHFHLNNVDNERINYDSYRLLPKDINYWKLRDSVTYFELFLLRILKFDLVFDLPHKYLIFYLKSLSDWIDNEPLMEKLFLMSWSLVNDYYCYHPKSLEWPSHHTALATIEISIESIEPKLKRIIENKQTGKAWYSNFDSKFKKDSIETIINQILKMYNDQYRNNSRLKVDATHLMEKHNIKSH